MLTSSILTKTARTSTSRWDHTPIQLNSTSPGPDANRHSCLFFTYLSPAGQADSSLYRPSLAGQNVHPEDVRM